MNFKPVDRKQLAIDSLIQPGVYDFEVKTAVEGISKSSHKPMITLQIAFFMDDGSPRMVTDYLTEGNLKKLAAFAESTGTAADYDEGNMPASGMVGLCGRAKVRIDESEGYEPKNSVGYYLKPRKPELDGLKKETQPDKSPRSKPTYQPPDDDVGF